MTLLEQLALRIALRYLEGVATPENLDELGAQAVAKLRELDAKTPTKFDDKVLEILLNVVTEGSDAVEAELIRLGDAVVAGTDTEVDDKIWEVLKKAFEE